MNAAAPAIVDLEPAPLNVPRRISRFALEQRSRLQDDSNLGVQRLMWAILKDTLRCYQNSFDAHTVCGQRMFHDARQWIFSNDLTWVFSFENICLVLGIDGDRLRGELARWTRLRRRAMQLREVQ